MKIRKPITWICLLAAGALLAAPVAQADSWKKGSHHGDMKERFFKKAHMILKHQEELALSEETTEATLALKLKTKKEIIKKQAEIDLIAVDIKSELYADAIDLDRLNGLIDAKYAVKAEKAKAIAAAYAELKAQLSEAQWDTLKALKKEYRKDAPRKP